jgi:hypothetical protein
MELWDPTEFTLRNSALSNQSRLLCSLESQLWIIRNQVNHPVAKTK